jgi:hypothetical protein
MRPVVLGIACERFNALGVCGRQNMGRYDNVRSKYLWPREFFNRMGLKGDTIRMDSNKSNGTRPALLGGSSSIVW